MKILKQVFFLFPLFFLPGLIYSQAIDTSGRIQERIREIAEEKLKITPEQLAKVKPETRIEMNINYEKRAVLGSGEQQVTSNLLPESEVHAVINPNDSNHIVFSPIRYKNTGGSYTLNCPVIYTRNFGQKWFESDFVAAPLDDQNATIVGGGDPVLAFDANGKLYITWINLFIHGSSWDTVWWAMMWAYSNDSGATWLRAPDDKLGICRGKITPNYVFDEVYDKEWLATDISNSPYRNSLYVAYLVASTTSFSEGIYVRRKRAGDNNFTPGKICVSSSLQGVQFSNIVVDKKGYVHVLFVSTTNKTNYSLWHVISTDGGVSFSNPVIVCNLVKPSSVKGIKSDRLYPAPQLAVDISDSSSRNNLYVTFTASGLNSDLGNGAEIYFCRSTDSGQTWSMPIVINDDPKGVARDQFYSTINVNEKGWLAVSWYDGRYSSSNSKNDIVRYFMAFSMDGGKTFTKNFNVSGSATDFRTVGYMNNSFGVGEYNQVITTVSSAIPFWADGRDSTGNLNIYAALVPFTENPSGIYEISLLSAVIHLSSVYPQPVTEYLNIDIVLAEPAAVKISLINTNGQVVFEPRTSFCHEGKNTITINTDKVTQGTYILLAETKFGFFTRKIVKTN